MGSSSQAIRYPVATTGAGNIDALNRVLADLCTISNPKDGVALTLRRLVEEEARDLSGEAFTRSMDYLYERSTTFLDSNEVSKNLGALRAIYELIDVTISENASNVAKFSNYMRATFETKRDPEILDLASKVLGHLARSGGAMTADEVERQVCSVLMLQILDYIIWVALRDPTLAVRGKAVEALCACLHVIEKRETRYYRMFEATQDGLGTNAPVHSIHGSLLAVGELLRNWRLKISGYIREDLRVERASGFIALGEMDDALDGELINCLPTISSYLRDAVMFAPRRGRPSLEVLACVGNIAKAMGPTMEPHVRGLLDSMFSSGLCIPPLLPTIKNRLLEFISTILSRSHHSMPRQSASGHDLLEFARESIVVYLEDGDGATRKDVALCCCKLVANSFSAISSTQFSPSRINRSSGKRLYRVVEE
ncbi:hypothetical protein CQW23_29838, partial [Capsicum baccatum]